MSLSSPFIRRPIGTLLLTVGLALSGVAAFFVLPVAPLPQVDFPTVSVSANLPGASPVTMATSVASPLERRLQTIAGVTELTSRSGIGSTQITLQFDLSRDVDGAARDVQAAINAARADLPATLRTNPTYRKQNPADAPIMILALTSKTRTPAQVYDAVSNIVQQRLSQVQGVGNVEIGGGSLPAVRADLNPLALSRFGISLEDVRSALSAAAANRPKGVVENGVDAFQIYGNAPGRTAADYQNLVIAWRKDIAVRLTDVAHVYDGPEDVRTVGLFNGEKAVTAVISRQPGANIIATVEAVKNQIPLLRASLPADVTLEVASDRTTTIRASLREVEVTLVIATLLVVAVVSVFLRSLRATVVPFVAVVVSLLGTLGIMYLFKFSLNNLSLMALTVATGFVVDDAIVVLENIMRHVEAGMPRRQAALQGAREVGFTVTSISISLVAVFIPLLFMGGIVGRLFSEFAVTMTVAVLISLVISLTTTPMIASLLLAEKKSASRFAAVAEHGFDRALAIYARSLDWALANRGATLLLLLGAVALNVFLFITVPKGFFPEQDTGSLQGGLRADQSISFPAMRQKLTQIVDIIRKDPAIDTVVAFSGGSRAGSGFLFATLKARDKRQPARDVINRLRPQLARVTGVAANLNPVQDMRIGGLQSNSSMQYALKSDDPDVLRDAVQKMVAAMKKDPMLTDVDYDQTDTAMRVYLDVDRDTARRLGVTQSTIDSILYDAFGQRQVATIYSGLNQYHVVMEVLPNLSDSPDDLSTIYIPASPVSASGSTDLASLTNLTGGTVTATAGGGSGGGGGGGARGGGGGGASGRGGGGAQAAQAQTQAIVAAATVASSTGTRDASTGSAVNTVPLTMIPLSAIAHWSTSQAAGSVSHDDGTPANNLSFNLADNVTLGQASARVLEIQDSLKLPVSVRGEFTGTAKTAGQTTSTMPILILAAIAVIYIVLGILYESTIHPLTVLSTLPSAGLGAVAALFFLHQQLDLIALIGLILLIGIVKKNAILIIDFALDAERARGLSSLAAIREASLLRFRPILMTTMVAVLGALPLAIGFGEGAELRRPLGFTIIGGLIASQFITLLTTPVVYLALDRFRKRTAHEKLLARRVATEAAGAS